MIERMNKEVTSMMGRPENTSAFVHRWICNVSIVCFNAMITYGRGDPSKQYQVDGEQAFLYMLEREHCASKYSLMAFVHRRTCTKQQIAQLAAPYYRNLTFLWCIFTLQQ